MVQRITTAEFESAAGSLGWRVVADGARTRYRTRSFSTGARLVAAIAEHADAIGHHPDVDLRYSTVTVTTVTHDIDGLSDLDVDLARRISASAEELGVVADPDAVAS